jgi:tetratricopeptide (TPR) repeat protein
MKIILISCFSILLFPKNSIAVIQKEKPSSEINKEEFYKLQSSINEIKIENTHLKQELYEQKEELKIRQSEFQKGLKEIKEDSKERINIYVFFIGLFLAIIGWAINFFGKSAIKARVEEIIEDTAQIYAETKTKEILSSKITNEFVSKIIREKGEPEITKLLVELSKKGHDTIQNIEKKGNNVINSVWASPPRQEVGVVGEPKSDEEIKKDQENLRSEEFFNLAFNTKDNKVKIALYKDVLEIEPDNAYAYNNIGVAYNDLYEFEKALEHLNKSIKLDNKNALAYANRANSYNQLEMAKEALEDAEKSISLNPKLEWPYSIKGNIYTKQQKFIEAEETLTKAIKINPQSAVAFFNRGYFNEETKKYDESIKDYLKSIEFGHDNLPLVYNNLAVVCRRKKEFDKAIEYLEKARKINPDWPNLDGTMALVYADMGDEEKFFEYIKKALDKGCPVWNYLNDYAFDSYRDSIRLKKLIEPFEKNASNTTF